MINSNYRADAERTRYLGKPVPFKQHIFKESNTFISLGMKTAAPSRGNAGFALGSKESKKDLGVVC